MVDICQRAPAADGEEDLGYLGSEERSNDLGNFLSMSFNDIKFCVSFNDIKS